LDVALPSRGKNGVRMKSGEGCMRRIYGRPIYGDENGGGLEKRKRRAPDFVPVGVPASAWVRNRQAHRRALGRHAPFSCGLALPAAVPAGKARLDPRAVGRESESKTTEVLPADGGRDRKSTRLNSSHVSISYAVFCLKK